MQLNDNSHWVSKQLTSGEIAGGRNTRHRKFKCLKLKTPQIIYSYIEKPSLEVAPTTLSNFAPVTLTHDLDI